MPNDSTLASDSLSAPQQEATAKQGAAWFDTETRPGYGLDLRVAIRIMGFGYDAKHDRLIPPRIGPFGDRDGREPPPEFSTDMPDAWAVVEKLTGFVTEREHPWWSVAVFNVQRGQVGCRVYACPPGANIFDAGEVDGRASRRGHVIAESVSHDAPHAICLAALKALEASK